LEFSESNIPQFSKDGEKRCLKCQHCLAICPTGALSIYNKSPQSSDAISNPNPDEILNLIKSRRSVRKYKPQNLDKQRLDKLKDMLKWCPTGCNYHKLHFSFIDDIEVMDDIRNNTNTKLINLLSSKMGDIIFKKFKRYEDVLKSGEDVIFRGAPHMLVVSTPKSAPCKDVDPIIALSYFELYAQSLGIGTLWCGFALYCFKLFPDLCEYLKVPDGYKVSYVMLFGDSDVEYKRTTQPEDFEITSGTIPVNKDISILKKIKRFITNL
jgi:nitroreductase